MQAPTRETLRMIANSTYNKWIATLGLKGAIKAKCMLGKALKAEKARRKQISDAAIKKDKP